MFTTTLNGTVEASAPEIMRRHEIKHDATIHIVHDLQEAEKQFYATVQYACGKIKSKTPDTSGSSRSADKARKAAIAARVINPQRQ